MALRVRIGGRIRILRSYVIVQLLLLAAVPQGLTLCIARDGHTALELAHAEPCVSEVQRHHPTLLTLDAGETGNHPCQDVLLSEERVRQVEQTRTVPPLGSAISDSAPEPRRGPERVATTPPDFPPGQVSFRGTVVLLI